MQLWTVIKYELKKILSNRIAMLLLILAAVFMLIVSAQRYITAPEERHAWETEQEIEGRIMDGAFFEELRAWQKRDGESTVALPWRFAAIYAGRVFWYNDNKSRGTYDNWDESLFYERRQQAIDEFADEFSLNDDEVHFWQQQEESIEKPFNYRSTRDVQNLRELFQFTLTMTCLLIGIFLADCFSGEGAKRTGSLVYSSRYGHHHTLAAKLMAGVLFSLFTGCLMLLSAGLPVIAFSGLYCLDAPWYMVEPLSSITIQAGWMLALHTLSFFLGCVLTGLLTMFLSLLFNNSIATMGFVFAFVLADLFLAVPTKWRMLSQIRYLTPISVLLNTRVQDLRLTKLFGIYLNPFQTAPILYILCSAFFIIISIPIFYRRCISD